MKLGEVCLLTGDVRRLADFYKALLHTDNGSDNQTHQFILHGEVALTVYDDGTRENHAGQNICLAFTVEDIDAAYAQVQALGAVIVQPPVTQPWGAKNLCFLDPDGNRVYLRQLM